MDERTDTGGLGESDNSLGNISRISNNASKASFVSNSVEDTVSYTEDDYENHEPNPVGFALGILLIIIAMPVGFTGVLIDSIRIVFIGLILATLGGLVTYNSLGD